MTACNFRPCGRPASRKGLCQTHYRQDLRGGPLRPIRAKASARGRRGETVKLGALSLTRPAAEAVRRRAVREGVSVNKVITDLVERGATMLRRARGRTA